MKFMPRIFRVSDEGGAGSVPVDPDAPGILPVGGVRPLNRKEAIASGEDIAPVTREEYYLKELAEGQGGGSLDYVIPEQTVTLTDSPVSIEVTDDWNIAQVLKIVVSGDVEFTQYVGLQADGLTLMGYVHDGPTYSIGDSFGDDGVTFSVGMNGSILAGTYTISAIRGF